MGRFSSLFCAFLLLLSPKMVFSAEWSVKGGVDQSFSYDDNVRMQRQDQNPQGSFKYMIVPGLTFAYKTDVSEIYAKANYGTQIYTDFPQFDQDIQHYNVGGHYNTERITWGLNSSYSVTPARNLASDNSGVFNTNSDRTNWSISPSASYKIDALNSLTLTPTYSETSFSSSNSSNQDAELQTNNSSFRNNTSIGFSADWQRMWTERYSTNTNFFFSNFETSRLIDGQSFDTSFDSIGLNFSNTYLWSQNWRLTGAVGIRHTDSTLPDGSTSSFGFLTNSGIIYTGENFTSGLNFSRSLMPSNQGQLQEQTRVGLNFRYKIDERLSASLNTSYLDSSSVNEANLDLGGQTISRQRENILIQPSVHWLLSRDVSLTGSYRYRNQKTNQGEFDSNLFMLSVDYNWQGFNYSK